MRREVNPVYFDIIHAFFRLTGCPLIVNTSFNVRGEPIVCTPEDAIAYFQRTHIDVLVLENFIVERSKQGVNGPTKSTLGFSPPLTMPSCPTC